MLKKCYWIELTFVDFQIPSPQVNSSSFYYQFMDIPKQQSPNQAQSENKMQPEQVILISSDQNQQPGEVVNQQNQMEEVQFKPVAPPDRQERERAQREQRIRITEEIIRKQLMQTQEDKKLLEELRIKQERRKQEALVQKQLHKMYPTHKFLPTPRLKYIREQLQNYKKVCIFEPYEGPKGYSYARQQFRFLFTQVLLLTIEEIKHKFKPVDHSECQKQLMLPQSDGLIYCYNVAKQFQTQLFTRLVVKKDKNVTNKYHQQTKIIQRQLEDDLHISFRRNFLNRKADFPKIIYAKKQQLISKQRKQYEKQELQIFLRQHQKEPTRYRRQSESESEPTPPPPPPPPPAPVLRNFQSASSFASIPQPVDDTPKETPEQRNAREKKQYSQSLQAKITRTDQSFVKNLRLMERREQELLEKYAHNQFFMSLVNNERMSDD